MPLEEQTIMNQKRTRKPGLSALLLALLAWGCDDALDPAGQGQGGATLPMERFFQVPPAKVGAVKKEGSIWMTKTVSDGVAQQERVAGERSRLRVQEVNGKVVYLSPPGFFFGVATKGTPAFRLICAAEVNGVRVGKGPGGAVYRVPRPGGARLLCWGAARRAGAPWSQIEVARSTAGRDTMFALLGIGGEKGDTVEVAYLRDSRYDPLNFRGRSAQNKLDAVVLHRLTLRGDAWQVSAPLQEEAYPSAKEMLNKVRVAACPASRCGKLFDQVDRYLSCGDCPTGQQCQATFCTTLGQACQPRKRAEACAAEAGQPRCGLHPDGCGGVIDCGQLCPSGATCGGGDRPLYCGTQRTTITRLKGRYKDRGDQLCGVFRQGSHSLDLSSFNRSRYGRECPVKGDRCQDNLCPRPTPGK